MERKTQFAPVAGAAMLFAALAWSAADAGGGRLVAAAVLGALCGVALYHASFGFTGGWRRLQRERRGAGFRAQLLLLAMIIVFSYPLIAYDSAINAWSAETLGVDPGLKVNGWVFPVGASTAIGAAMFGLGMQLGGGCGSGTLFTVGGGSTRMVITLLFFVLGSLIWTGTNADFQTGLDAAFVLAGMDGAPGVRGFSFLREWGALAALGSALAALALLAAASIYVERRAHGRAEPLDTGFGDWLRGPWTKTQGALALAAVSVLTLIILSRPWGVTSAFPLWGAKMVDAVGVPIREWSAWSSGQVDAPLFGHTTGVMNFGLMLGALAAAGLAGKFAPVWRLSARDIWTAVLGGLLMGYGARLAFGCNIGALLGGVASGSLHGWWWLLFGWLGSAAGVALRSRIGVDPPLPRRAATA